LENFWMTPKVLVAGAGPVGLTLAIELVRYGVPVRIVDKSPARTDKSKAVAVWARSLELFDRAGIADRLVPAGVTVRAANISDGAEKIARISFDGLDTRYSFVLMIPQSETERILEERLAELGVTVERGVELTGFTDKGGSVVARIQRPDGSSETVEADWLVGCDGAHSIVRHTLGKEFRGDTVDTDFLLADIRLENAPTGADELMMWWHHEGIVAFFPLPGGRLRLIASTGAPADPASNPSLAEVQALIDRRGPGGLVATDPVWLARFRINERKVDDYRTGRVFLAGDAAHIHSPAGGQGMNTGMQDAFNLAWKLALVCHGAAGEGLLESYSAERSPVAAEVISSAGKMTRAAMLKNEIAQALRNFVVHHVTGLHAIQHVAGETLSELAVGYPESPLNGAHAHGLKGPAPGHRLTPAGRPVGGGDSPRFALFANGDAPAELGPGFPQLLEENVRAPVEPDGIWLVRPDGYVALTARAGDWHSVEGYLAGLQAGGRDG
jgi:2-polyprenyl-6-methoxyphenol hydroxylase-like FAD-dependent oxidoreductase